MIPADFANALNACKEPDWVLLGIIADWLEDHGDEMAGSLRWAVRERKWPKGPYLPPPPEPGQFAWLMDNAGSMSEMRHTTIGMELARCWNNYGWYSTIVRAFEDLHQMLVKSKTNVTPPPERP